MNTTKYKTIAQVISIVVIAVACLVIIGWIFNIALLKSLAAGLATMKANTALAFILVGLSLNIASKEDANVKLLLIGRVCALVAAFLAFLTLSEDIFGWNLGIDQLIFRDLETAPANHPGRMSIATAICFVGVGVALLLTVSQRDWLAHVVAILVSFIALLALLGYFFSAASLYAIFVYSSMALHTAVAFLLLSLGILCVHPKRGLMTIITSQTVGGMMARRLLPAALFTPLLLNSLIRAGAQISGYDASFGLALLALSTVVILCALIFWIARLLYNIDIARQSSVVALRQAEEKYRNIFENATGGIFQSLPSGELITANVALVHMLGYESAAELMADFTSIGRQLYSDSERYAEFEHQLKTQGIVHQFETELLCRDGRKIWVLLDTHSIRDDNDQLLYYQGTLTNITPRKQLAAENEKLMAQFYQAQKMESIGSLAAGIAHDFNNLLVPIMGYGDLGAMIVAPTEKAHAYFVRIKDAANQAASLTRQILAYSRQQILEMTVLDLNEVIEKFQGMLRHIIEEDIDLQFYLAPSVSPIKADRGQVEQIIMNLVVNARDAMRGGGTLTIETDNVILDEKYITQYDDFQPGNYVMLAVTDTGHGMEEATKQKIFDPFFTTKTRDKGTGLGLATVFGIVKQHLGNIWVYSELDHGTTFKICFPISEASTSLPETQRPAVETFQGTETVLVVEDESAVRLFVCETLQAHGYQVLEAENPKVGLALAAEHSGVIHLLVTDVIMPIMSGPEFYQELSLIRSDMKVLFMSGYTDNVLLYNSLLKQDEKFLQKPFTLHALLQKVRELLG
jgi:PAS domain S-box-containing protein